MNCWLYNVIAGVLDRRDAQHEEQRDSGGEPGQRGHCWDGLSAEKWQQGLKVEVKGDAGQEAWRLYLEDQQ